MARALALLESDQAGLVTVAALKGCGVTRPGQAVYALQLAGYAIERVSCTDPRGRRTLGHRIHSSGPPASGGRESTTLSPDAVGEGDDENFLPWF